MKWLLTLAALPAAALAVPVQYTHQGQVLGADGLPITGTVALTVALCPTATPTPGESCYEETFSDSSLVSGYYAVRLGVGGGLDHSFFDQPALFVDVLVDGVRIGERTPLDAVPYATNVRGGVVEAAEVRIDGLLRLGNAPDSACTADTVGALILRDGSLAVCDGDTFIGVGARVP